MPQDAHEILVAAKADIWIAPVGTSLPTTESGALNGSFINLGYTSEDGTNLNYTQTTEEVMAHQTPDPVRRLRTGSAMTAVFNLLQFNQASWELAFGGGTWSEPSPGSYRYDPPDENDALAEYAGVLDWEDEDKKTRLVIPRGTVSEDVETTLARTAASVLPISLKALKPDNDDPAWYSITNDPAFAEAS